MARKIMIANEAGGLGGLPYKTMFPSLERRTPVRGTHIAMSDEQLLGPKLWKRLQVALEARRSPEAIMEKARTVLAAHDETLRKRFGDLMPSHMVGIDVTSEDGFLHRLADSKGNPAFDGVFDVEFWTRSQGDLTLKDVNEVLPKELRGPNFGRPTAKKAV